MGRRFYPTPQDKLDCLVVELSFSFELAVLAIIEQAVLPIVRTVDRDVARGWPAFAHHHLFREVGACVILAQFAE